MTERSYATSATAEAGHVRIDDIESLRFSVTTPDVAESTDDLTPERLYAAALAACLRQTVVSSTTNGDLDISDVSATVTVTLAQRDGTSYELSAEVWLDFPHVADGEAVDALVQRTVDSCPMSDNVVISVGSAP